MVGRVSGNTYRHLVKFAACQSPQLTYCRRKYRYAILSGSHNRNKFIFKHSSPACWKCLSTVQTNTTDDIRQESQGDGKTDGSDSKKTKHNFKVIGATFLCTTIIGGCIFVLLEWGMCIVIFYYV